MDEYLWKGGYFYLRLWINQLTEDIEYLWKCGEITENERGAEYWKFMLNGKISLFSENYLRILLDGNEIKLQYINKFFNIVIFNLK